MLIRLSFILRRSLHFKERKTTMETEMKSQTKKEWATPELIVLVQSKPEEAVLVACRSTAALRAGPLDLYSSCVPGSCNAACESRITS